MKLRQLHQTPWLAALLALSLVLSQALWLLHRVAHSGVAHSGVAHSGAAHVAHVVHFAHAKPSNADGDAAHGPSAWLKALLPEHADELSCAHFDQLSHTDVLPVCCAPSGLSQAPAHELPATHVASSLAAQAAGFLARGPPVTV